jgi:hypothetical protein
VGDRDDGSRLCRSLRDRGDWGFASSPSAVNGGGST